MKTQKEYMAIIKKEFADIIESNKNIFDAYNYSNHKACDLIIQFRKNIERCGLKFSKCYHANGIGNNNENTIFIETTDDDGFVVQKNVASFYYCYGIFGGCYVSLTDLATNEKFAVSRAR